MFGCKWRRIAAQLQGRSDDAVRNRWNRLKEARDGPVLEGAEGGEAAPPPAPRRRSSGGGRKSANASAEERAGGGGEGGGGKEKDKGAKPERMSWTKAEDATIVNGVQELGHKWCARRRRPSLLAPRLPHLLLASAPSLAQASRTPQASTPLLPPPLARRPPAACGRYQIAKRLPGRTNHAIRNRYHRLQAMMHDQQLIANQSQIFPPTQAGDHLDALHEISVDSFD